MIREVTNDVRFLWGLAPAGWGAGDWDEVGPGAANRGTWGVGLWLGPWEGVLLFVGRNAPYDGGDGPAFS